MNRNKPRHRRPAYTVVRSLILAVSTLAIVGVLFAVYQFSTGVEPAAAPGAAVVGKP
ncbi:MAG: hypothetical protein HOP29_15935, partial [Phycisphaerales bacterium]|nr:hypothetical protein [Phycisphaerales bacterium]